MRESVPPPPPCRVACCRAVAVAVLYQLTSEHRQLSPGLAFSGTTSRILQNNYLISPPLSPPLFPSPCLSRALLYSIFVRILMPPFPSLFKLARSLARLFCTSSRSLHFSLPHPLLLHHNLFLLFMSFLQRFHTCPPGWRRARPGGELSLIHI